KVNIFADQFCTDSVVTYSHVNALMGNNGEVYLAYAGSSSTPPDVTNPPIATLPLISSLEVGISTEIILPYTDSNLANATSCSIDNIHLLTIDESCSCDLLSGECSVRVTAVDSGVAYFNFTITTPNGISAAVPVSLNVNPPPIVEVIEAFNKPAGTIR